MDIRGNSWFWGERTYLMGIVNVTPDSFSDGGEYNSPTAAVSQIIKLINGGADIIDIGGQSTRPGAGQISVEEELNRIIPIIKAVRAREIYAPISVDTTKSRVAIAAIEAGADMVNDISGGTYDPEMLPAVAKLGVPIVLMHIRGTPETMQTMTDYQDLVEEISQFLATQIQAAIEAGIKRSRIIVDPGIGFAKTYEQNLKIIRRLKEFRCLGLPILLGPSRKNFIGHIINRDDPQQRVWGTAAACCAAIAGGVDILRVHDVIEMYDVCRVADAIWRE